MSIPGGIRAKLTLTLLVIVGGALAVAYLLVIPSLEARLVDANLDRLEQDITRTVQIFSADDLSDQRTVEGIGETYGVRVVLYQAYGPPLRLAVVSDSAGGSAAVMARDPIALEAASTGAASGRVTRAGAEHAEAAQLLFTGQVLLFSDSLEDQLAIVSLVARRLLQATVVALLVAGLLGAAAAAAHAQRIRRLERAANRIAEGSFDEPVVDLGDDELGELASSFDRMRVQLRQLDNARKEFVANASHELRTPLFSLAGFLELLADEDLDDATRAGFLDTTREQVARLTSLTANLLDLSRLDAGSFRVEREEVSLTEVARTLVDELMPLAEAEGHVLELDADGAAWALADEERVAQVGRALVGNAIAHTPRGTTVRIRAGAGPAGAELVVADDGPGIPHEHQERIFDRFYRVEGPHASGSGLGLAIARELALRMSGELTVVSRPGSTSFTLRLPALQAVPAGVAASA